MKLWQKDFKLNHEIEGFTIGDDQKIDLYMAPYDVIGSIAHAKMLKESRLLTVEEWKAIVQGLKEIYQEVIRGDFKIEEGVEDIHSQVELLLTRKIGEPGKKIHTARSRNDQVLLDLKLYYRDEIISIAGSLESLSLELVSLSEKNKDIFMPGYTHFQAAMPSTFGLWFGAYAECFSEDIELLQAAYKIINRNPLGSAAGFGSSFPIQRKITTDLLGFESLNINSIAAQMGRGRSERILSSTLAQAADTLGRLSSEICLYMGQDFGFFKFPDELTTGSSIMPHKKNPDVFELIRGKCNQIKSLPQELLLQSSNLPSGYHRDYQLMKSRVIWMLLTIKECIEMMNFTIRQIIINTELRIQDKYKFLFSVERINELVKEGLPFRDAYKKVSDMIKDGSFRVPGKTNYTHEGSAGNLQNDKITDRLVPTHSFFNDQSEIIKTKFKELLSIT